MEILESIKQGQEMELSIYINQKRELLSKLDNILYMIDLNNSRLKTKVSYLEYPNSANIWLFTTRSEVRKDIDNIKAVGRRLENYFNNNVIKLAL